MKKSIHPEYGKSEVTCACGNKFTIHSTSSEMRVELCYKCHPFYTGEQKMVDTANRVKNFESKRQEAKKMQKEQILRKEVKVEKDKQKEHKTQGPMTLRDMMQAIQNKK